ncbi:Sodium/hydrogen exchanger family [Musa troglodytarum]|uniref:Sodium/hydrogen exchanger family n=1 Tax=Musa troglodytarum TaxID=320322 RepID=A0A9E7IG56_9LILI|nr:Sodium/hydrogen exchanger family [Musa troglodytarum]
MGMLRRRRRPLHPRSRRGAGSLLLSFLFVAVFFGLAYLAGAGDSEAANATEPLKPESAKEGSFADMIDRALQKEFPESEQNGGETDPGGFNNSVAEKQAVLETVARVTTKKNETKEEKSFQFQDVFNLDNENRAEDIPTLIDRKDNVFIISNPKSKYPILQLDLRLISDLVVVIVSATCGGIAFACAGQPVITGYLLAGSIIGPGGFRFISEMVQVETVAQFGVIFLLFALGLEFSTTKLRVVRAVAIVGGFLQIALFMCLCGVIASVLKFLMEKNSINALHGQVTVGTLILQDCAVGLLFALLPVLGGTSGVLQGLISATKSLIVLCAFLAILSILSRTCVPWFLRLMISLSSQTNELYQLASVAFCLLVAWCSDKLGLSLELGSFAAGVMISTTDLSQHTLEQIEPIRNFFAALFLASIGMLIHVHFLWNHVDILLAAVILVIIVKTLVITLVVKGFGYSNKASLLVGMSLAQIGEFAFVLLSRASNLHLVEGKLYLLLLGTTALSLVTTPLLFKLIPAVIHLGVLLRWFTPDSNELGYKGDNIRSDSANKREESIGNNLESMASPQSLQGWFPWVCGEVFDLGSACTQRSLMDLLNILFLVIYSASLLIIACFRRQHNSRSKRRRWDFIVISVCCALTGIAYFSAGVRALSLEEDELMNWIWPSYFARSLIWIAVAVSLIIQPTEWVQNLSLIWWTSSSLAISAHTLNLLLNDGRRRLPILDLLSWSVNLLLLYCAIRLAVQRYLHKGNPKDSVSRPLPSENRSNHAAAKKTGLLGRLTFSWLNPLLRLGFSKPLHLDDIPPLDLEDEASYAYKRFFQIWDVGRGAKGKSRNLVSSALAECYLMEILITSVYALVKTVAVSASPILLYVFVQYNYREERDLYMGLALVGFLMLLKLVESLSQRHWFFESRRLGMRMRSALMAAIFEKMLKLSSHGRRKHSTGEIVNYIAVDAYRLGDFPYWFHMAWSQPLQLLFSVAILFWAVGVGALPGLVPLIILGIANVPFAKILQSYQSEFMSAQDERLRATSEALNSMKIIKLQSWEEHFRKMIQDLRDVEFNTIFTVLATLRVMSEPVRMLPEVLSILIQVKVSLDRINTFLNEDEIKEDDVKRSHLQNSNLSVRLRNGVFCWEAGESIPTLENLNLTINKGEKVAVCGPVGSGKSSLLHAILGEIPKLSGSVEVVGSIAYVSQTSWIQSGTIRDNVLYGKPMDEALYEKAIKSCALDKDIDNFDHGDLTEIGQRGLNMSGGQKQRIQLARAVYNDADMYLLDDPFSAVDAHTAAILFHDCVMSALEKKTVVLVTHQVEFLPETDRILVMEHGRVAQEGTYEQLLKSGTAFEQLVNAHQSSMNMIDSSSHGNQNLAESAGGGQEHDAPQPTKQESEIETSSKGLSAAQLTEDEETEIGDLGWKPHRDYLQVSKGYTLLVWMILLQSVFVLFQSLSGYWLAVVAQLKHVSGGILVGVYAVISILSCLFAYARSLVAAQQGLNASKAFFSSLMDSVFKAPMSFFDSTPVGRILTRASSDLSILDFDIPYSIVFVIAGSIELSGTIVIMASVTWQVLIVAVPAMIRMIFVQRYYVASARELVRINGTTKAPAMNYAAESLNGVVTIRAFGTIDRFIQTNLRLIDTDAALFYYTIGTLEWVLLRVEALQNLTIFTSSLCLVLLPQTTISPGFSGLCLSYAFTLSSCQVFLTRFYSTLENCIISVERIKQFMHIPSEPPAVIHDKRPHPPTWPSEGRIDLQDLKVRYRPNAPLVLKGITCTFASGHKIGVVGRTGSGKTTLISALFRLVDPTCGRILIDGVDICSIGLKDLRMKLSIIPQEPTLFRGSIRSNLDPLGLHTDREIWEALEKCQLKTAISTLPTLLDSAVNDDGQNWSAGQRQLFCLGRVLLRKNRVLVLDEATASIDSATDAVLQRVIKEEFASCTVITIAHRVPTVTDSDMVMVLSYGKLVEYDNPSRLIENRSSAFAKLVAEYWSNCRRDSAHSLSSY